MIQENKQKEEYSQENQNLEIVKPDNSSSSKQLDVDANKNSDSAKNKKNIIIGTLNVFVEPLKNRHEKHYRDSNFHLVADLIFVLTILSLFSFLLWVIFFKPVNLQILLESKYESRQITSGAMETFELNYDNKSGENVYKASLAVRLPDDLMIQKVVPEQAFDYNTNTFYLGDLSNGANGKIKISAFLVGTVGGQDEISFIMNYFNKKNKQLSALNILKYNIENTALETKLDIPEQVYENVDFIGKIKIKNQSKDKLENVVISYPGEWGIEKSYCSLNDLSDDRESWLIKELASGEDVLIEFAVKTNRAPGVYPVDFLINIKSGEINHLQEKIQKSITIQKLDFNAALKTESLAIKSGQKIEYSLSFSNNSNDNLKDINFSLASKDNDFALSKIDFKGSSDICQTDGKTIKISKLSAGQSGNINFSASLDRKAVKTNQTAGIKATVSYVIKNQAIKYDIVSQPAKILSNLNVKTAGYFFSAQGDQLGVGPLPPIVGIPTSYWIFLEIENYGNDIKNFNLSAQLPEDIIWTGNKSLLSGNLLHGEVGGRVIWEIEKISKEGGAYKAGFEITIIPGKQDVGKTIDLVKDINFTAFDEFCQETLIGKNDKIDTNLKYDKLSIGKDKVAAE